MFYRGKAVLDRNSIYLYCIDINQIFEIRTFTYKWFFSQLTIRSINEINELTVHSINSLNPGNDPDSMVAFLPNVRRNTMEKIPGDDPRSKFVRKNTLERIPIKSRFTTIPVETKAGWRTDCFGTLPYRKVFWKLGFWNCINLQPH